jgi:hypothetical protein
MAADGEGQVVGAGFVDPRVQQLQKCFTVEGQRGSGLWPEVLTGVASGFILVKQLAAGGERRDWVGKRQSVQFFGPRLFLTGESAVRP